MRWIIALFVVVAVAVLARIYFNLRRIRRANQRGDWDAQQIQHLRALGSDPFKEHVVDFFFGLPSEPACAAVSAALEHEGFAVDAKPVPEAVDEPFSLHATRSMRLSVPDMQELSRRFGELAESHGGRYDGWAAGVVPQDAGASQR
ncbi:MAG: ribonuclease E inhibitor RraB [Steroidobacteraceae bacterium]